MERPIETLGSNLPLESIEKSVKTLQGILAGRKVQPTAQNEAKAFFGGLLNSFESICNNTIANSGNMSPETLENSYTQIDRIYTMMREVGENLSVETKSAAQQVDTLFSLVEVRKKEI